MIVRFYRGFSKRKNSTKLPDANYKDVDCKYKDNVSFNSPVLLLSDQDVVDSTYVKIGDIYYFVSDVTRVTNNLYSMSLVKDVLATYRTVVLSSSQIIDRCVNGNRTISDVENFPTTFTVQHSVITQTPVLFDSTKTGCCIIGVVSDGVSSEKSGLARFYALNIVALQRLANFLASGTILEDLQKQFSSGMGGFLSCKWINIPYTQLSGGVVSSFSIGNLTIDVGSCKVLSVLNYHGSKTINYYIPDSDHPDYYINRSPYTEVYCYLPYVGTVHVDGDIHDPGNLIIDQYVDISTGIVTYTIEGNYTDTKQIPITAHIGTFGVDIPLLYSQRNIVQAVSGAYNAVMGLMARDVKRTASGLENTAIGMLQRDNQLIGSIGTINNAMMPDYNICTLTITHEPAHSISNLSSRVGLPYNRLGMLSNFSGFVRCRMSSITIDGYDGDREQIETMLNNGIYIE